MRFIIWWCIGAIYCRCIICRLLWNMIDDVPYDSGGEPFSVYVQNFQIFFTKYQGNFNVFYNYTLRPANCHIWQNMLNDAPTKIYNIYYFPMHIRFCCWFLKIGNITSITIDFNYPPHGRVTIILPGNATFPHTLLS